MCLMRKTIARITCGSGAQELFYVPNANRASEQPFYGHWMGKAQVALTPQQIEDALSVSGKSFYGKTYKRGRK